MKMEMLMQNWRIDKLINVLITYCYWRRCSHTINVYVFVIYLPAEYIVEAHREGVSDSERERDSKRRGSWIRRERARRQLENHEYLYLELVTRTRFQFTLHAKRAIVCATTTRAFEAVPGITVDWLTTA